MSKRRKTGGDEVAELVFADAVAANEQMKGDFVKIQGLLDRAVERSKQLESENSALEMRSLTAEQRIVTLGEAIKTLRGNLDKKTKECDQVISMVIDSSCSAQDSLVNMKRSLNLDDE